jgi:hypothetical protein
MKAGDKARIVLKNPKGILDEAINGRVGILSDNDDPYVPYEFCVRLLGVIVGVNTAELELVEEGTNE